MPTKLTPQQEQFCRLYYAGPEPLRGNATRCYLEVYYGEHERYEYGDPTYQAAAASASRALKGDRVSARIAEIRDEAAEAARNRARSWWEIYPDAQQTLWRAITGSWPEHMQDDDEARRSAVKAAQEVVARCEGTPQQVHEHRHTGGIAVIAAGPEHALEAPEAQEGRRSLPEQLRAGPRYIEASAEERS